VGERDPTFFYVDLWSRLLELQIHGEAMSAEAPGTTNDRKKQPMTFELRPSTGAAGGRDAHQVADIGFVPWSDRSLSPASENLARSCESPDLGDPSFPSSLGYGKQKNKVFQRFKALAAKATAA
jgi:hypothetical protein